MSNYYLTDYDVPANNPSRRVAFYRARRNAIKEAMKDRSAQVLFSSQSVVISDDKRLADTISDLAKYYHATAAHVFEIHELELVSGFDKQEV
jgi:hypothetical protein